LRGRSFHSPPSRGRALQGDVPAPAGATP
jgi:hypothetical protein